MGILRYLRLKFLVSLVRLLVWLRRGTPRASPDSVLHIPSRDRNRTIKVHVYNPPGGSTSAAAAAPASTATRPTPSPVLINLHGSGFVLAHHGSDDTFCRLISRKTGHTVLDTSYRLAPEHPFPAALHDAEDVLRWVLSQPTQFDAARISLSGFSAGANLALAASAVLFPPTTFRCLLAFYPTCDRATAPAAKRAPDPAGRATPPFMARVFSDAYIPAGVDARDPRISPRWAQPERFPDRLFVVTCAFDNLAPEAEELAERVREVGGEGGGRRVVVKRMEGVGHAWDKGAREGTEAARKRDEAYGLAVEMLVGE